MTNDIPDKKWPKRFPPFTPEQRRISDDFMKYWHEVLPKKYGLIERFNHLYPVKHAPDSFETTLEIGAGLAEHVEYERLTPSQKSGYVALELRRNMVEAIRAKYLDIQAVEGSCEDRLDFADGHFDRILGIHVLEHLPNLPAAIREMHRLINKDRGIFSVVIPCEGSLAYLLARKVSAQRIFEKRYRQTYKMVHRARARQPSRGDYGGIREIF